MRTLTAQDLEDILLGAAHLGTGGGGELSEGRGLIQAALDAGKTFRLVRLDEVPDEALVCTPYLLGALSPLSPAQEAAYADLPRPARDPLLHVYRRMQAYLGAPFHGVIACELGGANTAAAFYCAAMMGHVILDADPSGRAVPEVQHTTYTLAGLAPGPMVLGNAFGETFVYEGVPHDRRAEGVARALAVISRNDIAAIDHALPFGTLKNALIPGTISLSLRLGQALRGCPPDQAAQVVARIAGGHVVATGQVRCVHDWVEGGFTHGTIEIAAASGPIHITYKNENMIARQGDVTIATIPDLICLVDRDTGAPVTNPFARAGQAVDLVCLPAHPAFATQAGVALFGPAYLGLEEAYRPYTQRLGL
ncbi:MAG: DUF917 domain-containing protein [Pseudomonadota bacterium]